MVDAQTCSRCQIVEAERHLEPPIETIANQVLDPSTAGGCEPAANDRGGLRTCATQLFR